MIERKKIGETEHYRGHEIEVRHMGPDLLCHVDGRDVGNFYLDAEAARRAGRKYIDAIESNKPGDET